MRGWHWTLVAITATVGCGGASHWLGSGPGDTTCFLPNGELACNTRCLPEELGIRCSDTQIWAACLDGTWICSSAYDAGASEVDAVGTPVGVDAAELDATAPRSTCLTADGRLACSRGCLQEEEGAECSDGETIAICSAGTWYCRTPAIDASVRGCFSADGTLACNTPCTREEIGDQCLAGGLAATCNGAIWVCDRAGDAGCPTGDLDASRGPTCFDPSGRFACGTYCRPDEEGQSCGPNAAGETAICITGVWACFYPAEAYPPPEPEGGVRALDCFYTNGVLACNQPCRSDEEGARCTDRGVLATCGAGIWICDALPQADPDR